MPVALVDETTVTINLKRIVILIMHEMFFIRCTYQSYFIIKMQLVLQLKVFKNFNDYKHISFFCLMITKNSPEYSKKPHLSFLIDDSQVSQLISVIGRMNRDFHEKAPHVHKHSAFPIFDTLMIGKSKGILNYIISSIFLQPHRMWSNFSRQ